MSDRFKLELDIVIPLPRTVTYKFKTLKVLRQWQKRHEDLFFFCINSRMYQLSSSGIWEKFTVIGKNIVTENQLETILSAMKAKSINELNPDEWQQLRNKFKAHKNH